MKMVVFKRAWGVVAGLVGLATVSMGCAASSEYMKPAQTSMTAPSDKALVWFARSGSFAKAMKFTILDEKGTYLGDSLPNSRFASIQDPGEHYYYAWAENVGAMKATLAAGKVYWISVRPRIGMWTARAAIFPVNRKSDEWAQRDEWTKSLTLLSTDVDSGRRYHESIKVDVDAALKLGKETWEGYSPEEKTEVTLVAEDGT